MIVFKYIYNHSMDIKSSTISYLFYWFDQEFNISTTTSITSGLTWNATNICISCVEENCTFKDAQEIIAQANKEYSYNSVIVILFMLILLLAGLGGNFVVIFVLAFKKKRSITNYFMLCLALVDISSCLFLHPYIIYKQFHIYSTNQFTCKVFEFAIHTSLAIQTGILFSIAVDRFIGVCQPLKSINSYNRATSLVSVAFAVGVTVSLPMLVFYGTLSIKLASGNCDISGYICNYNDIHDGTLAQGIYSIIKLSLLVCAVVSMTMFYSLVACAVHMGRRRIIPLPPQDTSKHVKSEPTSTLQSQHALKQNGDDEERVQIIPISEQGVPSVPTCSGVSTTKVHPENIVPISIHQVDHSTSVLSNTGEQNENIHKCSNDEVSNHSGSNKEHIKYSSVNLSNEVTTTLFEPPEKDDSSLSNDKLFNSPGSIEYQLQTEDNTIKEGDSVGTSTEACHDKRTDMDQSGRKLSISSDSSESAHKIVNDGIPVDGFLCTSYNSKSSNSELNTSGIVKPILISKESSVKNFIEPKILSDTCKTVTQYSHNVSQEKGTGSILVQRDNMETSKKGTKMVTFEEYVTIRSVNSQETCQAFTQFKSKLNTFKRQSKLRGTKMLFVVTTLFFLSWLPFWVIKIGHTYSNIWENRSSSVEAVYRLLNHLFYLNNAVNPLVYTIFNSSFRDDCQATFKRIQCCVCLPSK